MSIQLPVPIERYVQIANSGTAEAAAECFAPDATVYARDAGAQICEPPGTMCQTARIAMRGALAHLSTLNSTSDQGGDRAPAIESAPDFIREGQRIKIPQGSPLRGKLTISAVAAKEIQRTLTFTGVVEADPSREVQVLAPVAGRVVDVKIQLGDRVTPDQELALVYAQADRRAHSTPALPNQPTASDRQTGPRSKLDDAARDCQRVEAEPPRSTPRLCALIMPVEGNQDTRLFSLRAPVAGSVIDVSIRPGAMLDDPSSSIMTIADLGAVWVTTSLRKNDTALIATRWPVAIAFVAYPNEVFMGEARLIGDTIDPYASSFKVRIELPNPSRRLKPNMFALATFLGPKETVPIIPATALILKNERDQVFVEVEQWTFEARPVNVDFLQDDENVVVSGLNIGERIVVMGGALLEH
jgi:membrane fusion protein, heavy metal efflux system